LEDSKEGESIRPIGLPVVEYLERRRTDDVGTYVFPGQGEDNAFGSFPNHWKHLFGDSALSDITPHVLRHSFASIANDLGFTEVTIAALVGHAKTSGTSTTNGASVLFFGFHWSFTILEPTGKGRPLCGTPALYASIMVGLATITLSTSSVRAEETTAQSSYPLKSENAIPLGDFSEYLSCA
jgi:hypothetical protein